MNAVRLAAVMVAAIILVSALRSSVWEIGLASLFLLVCLAAYVAERMWGDQL